MKKFTILFLAAVLAFLIAVPAQAASKDMWADVYRYDGKMNIDGKPVLTRATTGITFKVLQADSDTAETLTVRGSSTSLTNPVTTTNFASDTVCADRVAFRVDPGHSGDENVDLIVVDTVGGYTTFVEDFNQYEHTIIIDERPNVMHHGMIWFTSAAAETDTGVDFDYDSFISDVRIEFTSNLGGITIDVGLLSSETSGDADGFIDGQASMSGYTYDSGGVISYGPSHDFYGTTTYGSLLFAEVKAGANVLTRSGGKTFIGHVVNGANAKSITHTSSATGPAGYIHYWFTRLR